MEFIEAQLFTRLLPGYLTDDEYGALQQYMIANPEAGDTIQGTGGFRKLRWPDPRRGKGKRGGLRVVYYHLSEDRQIWLVAIFDKDEASDLTTDQKRALKMAIDGENRARAALRRGRKRG